MKFKLPRNSVRQILKKPDVYFNPFGVIWFWFHINSSPRNTLDHVYQRKKSLHRPGSGRECWQGTKQFFSFFFVNTPFISLSTIAFDRLICQTRKNSLCLSLLFSSFLKNTVCFWTDSKVRKKRVPSMLIFPRQYWSWEHKKNKLEKTFHLHPLVRCILVCLCLRVCFFLFRCDNLVCDGVFCTYTCLDLYSERKTNGCVGYVWPTLSNFFPLLPFYGKCIWYIPQRRTSVRKYFFYLCAS